jgi:tryptophan halogenase
MGPLNYAYHFDAGKFAALLSTHAQSLGVRHVQATVERVVLDADGAVGAVHTKEAGVLTADLYIDCTGFRAALIGEALGSKFRNINDVLFVDRALAMQVPYERPDAPIRPTPSPPRTKRDGPGTSACTSGAASATSIPAAIRTTRAPSRCCATTSARQADGLNPRQLKLNVGYRDSTGLKTAWRSACRAASWNRWNRPALG